jgi:hypothetical protein
MNAVASRVPPGPAAASRRRRGIMHRGAGVLATWEPYTLLAAGILSALSGQSAFNAGSLSLSL